MSHKSLYFRCIAWAAVALPLVSCATPQHGTQHDKVGVCQECFDAVRAARTEHPASGPNQNEVINTYECPCCKSEMSIYIQNGVHMVKCAGCAADGVAWDKCKPVDHQK